MQNSDNSKNNNKRKTATVTSSIKIIQAFQQSSFLQFLKDAPIGAIIWDLNFRIIEWNREAERIFGFKKEEVLGKHPAEIIVPAKIKDAIDEIFKQLLNKSGGSRSTNENITKDGKTIVCDWFNEPLTDSNGKVIGVASLVMDISPYKNYELTSTSFAKKLEMAQNAAGLGLIEWDLDTNDIFLTEKACNLLGVEKGEKLKPEELIKKTIHPDDLDLIKEDLFAAAQGKKKHNMDCRVIYPDGEIIWINSQTELTTDPVTGHKILIGMITDITARKLIERELAENEKRFREIFQNATIGIFRTTPDGKILLINDFLVEMLGYNSAEEVLKLDIAKDIYVNENERDYYVQELNAKEKIKNKIYNIKRKDGKILTVRESSQAHLDANGNVLYYEGIIEDITERIKAQASLIESEKKFKTLFEENLAGVYITELNFNLIDCNKAFLNIFGYESKEEIPPSADKLLYLSKTEKLNLIERLKNKGEIFNYEIMGKKKNGDSLWLILNLNYLENNTIIGTLIDISERKKNEEKIELFLKIIEQSPLLIMITDLEGNINYVNKAFENITGYSASEVAGRNSSEFGNLTKVKDDKIREKIIAGEIYKAKLKQNKKNGETFTEDAVIFSVKNKDGDVTNVVKISEDITEKEKAEQRLKLLNNALMAADNGIFITNIDGVIEWVNPAFTKLTGYSYDDVLGKTPRILKSNKHDKVFYENLWKTILSGNVWRGEIINKKKNGELYTAEMTITPVTNAEGQISNFVVVEKDITIQKQYEQGLIEAKEKAEEMNRLKTTFLHNMSHELRTPMVGILGYAEFLREALKDEELLSYTHSIIECGERLINTFDKILEFSSLEADKTEIDFTVVHANEILDKVVNKLSNSAEMKGLYIKKEIIGGKLLVYTDEKIFYNILLELVDNAVKYTHQGGVTVYLKETKFKNKKMVELKVCDTGIGISAENQVKIWEAFRQESEGLSRGFEGMGLGLALTKKLVKSLNGKISLESTPGKGSTFTILLPQTGLKYSS